MCSALNSATRGFASRFDGLHLSPSLFSFFFYLWRLYRQKRKANGERTLAFQLQHAFASQLLLGGLWPCLNFLAKLRDLRITSALLAPWGSPSRNTLNPLRPLPPGAASIGLFFLCDTRLLLQSSFWYARRNAAGSAASRLRALGPCRVSLRRNPRSQIRIPRQSCLHRNQEAAAANA